MFSDSSDAEKREAPKKKSFLSYFVYALLAIMAAQLFGLVPALVGCLVFYVFKQSFSRRYPDKIWPNVLAIAVAFMAALMSSIVYAVFFIGSAG